MFVDYTKTPLPLWLCEVCGAPATYMMRDMYRAEEQYGSRQFPVKLVHNFCNEHRRESEVIDLTCVGLGGMDSSKPEPLTEIDSSVYVVGSWQRREDGGKFLCDRIYHNLEEAVSYCTARDELNPGAWAVLLANVGEDFSAWNNVHQAVPPL